MIEQGWFTTWVGIVLIGLAILVVLVIHFQPGAYKGHHRSSKRRKYGNRK